MLLCHVEQWQRTTDKSADDDEHEEDDLDNGANFHANKQRIASEKWEKCTKRGTKRNEYWKSWKNNMKKVSIVREFTDSVATKKAARGRATEDTTKQQQRQQQQRDKRQRDKRQQAKQNRNRH